MRLLFFLLLLATNIHAGEHIIGKVVGVHDGDSITVLEEGRIQHKVRLEGIDAPELRQDFGQAAKKAMSDLVFGKTVALERTGRDRYKRLLARVYVVNGPYINLAMVRAGMAWQYLQYSKDKDLAEAQQEAMEAKRGLWQQPAVPPWEWRKK